jgi:uncharacterized repeat protein (TIGR01451 family)
MRKLFIFVSLIAVFAYVSISGFAQSNRSDLSVSQTVSANPAIAGTNLTYQITVSNLGPNAADFVTLTDVLPAGVRHQSNTSACLENPIGTLTCNLGVLPAGESRVISVNIAIAGNLVDFAGGNTLLRNLVSVNSPSRNDPNLSNNISSVETSVIASSDLSIMSMEIVNPPRQIIAGESIQLTLHTVIYNAGPSTPMDALFRASVSSSDDWLIDPPEVESEELALSFNQSRSLDTVFTIRCQGESTTLNFETEILPLDAESQDPNFENNRASAQITIDCEGNILTPVPTTVPDDDDDNDGDDDDSDNDDDDDSDNDDDDRDELEVEIDIRPNNPENTINLRSNGEIQVAILSDSDFDASTVDPSTIRLEGARVSREGNGDYKAHLRDVNQDGLDDLVVHIETEDIDLDRDDTRATLEAETFAGQEIEGSDTVRIVSNNGNGNGNSNGNSNGNGNGNSNGNGNGRGNN